MIWAASRYLSIKSSSVYPGLPPPLYPFVSFLSLEVPTGQAGKSPVEVLVRSPGAHTFALAMEPARGPSRVHVPTSYTLRRHYFEVDRFHDDYCHSHSYSYNFVHEKNRGTCTFAQEGGLVWGQQREQIQT